MKHLQVSYEIRFSLWLLRTVDQSLHFPSAVLEVLEKIKISRWTSGISFYWGLILCFNILFEWKKFNNTAPQWQGPFLQKHRRLLKKFEQCLQLWECELALTQHLSHATTWYRFGASPEQSDWLPCTAYFIPDESLDHPIQT